MSNVSAFGFIMGNNLVQANTLASLIESGCIHAVDFKCLDIDSKKNSLEIISVRYEINNEK